LLSPAQASLLGQDPYVARRDLTPSGGGWQADQLNNSTAGRLFNKLLPILVLRGILLKGNEVSEILPGLWSIVAFLLAAGTVALAR
jgi:hypothetical protein